MSRKLIIDGNAVYEIDEECMLKQKAEEEKGEGKKEKEQEENCHRGGKGR